LSNKQIVIVFN